MSFESEKILSYYSFIDCIVAGSGEIKLSLLMDQVKNKSLSPIKGVYFSNRLKNKFKNSPPLEQALKRWPSNHLDAIHFSSPYTEEERLGLKNRIIYYETMRGCPYRCSYCLSSLETQLTLKPLELVFSEIDLFFKAGVKQVKLVDRTFNCRPKRAMEIFKYIILKEKEDREKREREHLLIGLDTADSFFNFHFEMTGDQIPSEMIKFLAQAPKGLIQFEIGVQTTHEKTLKAIDRPINFEKTKVHVSELLKEKNIHIHLDLIAGLPYESYEIFGNSFNEVIALQPDMLQLGFLKGLNGTKIKNEPEKHDYEFSSFPPYEIVKNAYLSAEELYLLKDIETLLDRFYNSGYFKNTCKYLFFSKNSLKPFNFFNDFAKWWGAKGYFDKGISKESLYGSLYNFFKTCDDLFSSLLSDCLVYDYLINNQLKEPRFCKIEFLSKKEMFEFLKEDENRCLYLSEFKNWAPKKIYPQIKILKFNVDFYEFLFPEELREQSQLGKDHAIFLLLTKQGDSKLIII